MLASCVWQAHTSIVIFVIGTITLPFPLRLSAFSVCICIALQNKAELIISDAAMFKKK